MAQKRPYTLYGKLYGTLVLHGRRALDPDANPDGLPLVPERYIEQALAYLEYVANSKEKDA